MKKLLIPFYLQLSICGLIVMVSFLGSCKKASVENPEVNQLSNLAKEYNLSVVTANPLNAHKSFKSVTEFEAYLKSNKVIKLNVTANVLQKNQVQPLTDVGGIDNGGVISYTAQMYFDHLDDEGYPGYFVLNWKLVYNVWQISDITSFLLFNGSNLGQWGYTQTSGTGTYNDTASPMAVSGIYTEIFDVGGLYTYTRNYNVSFSGTWYRFSQTIDGAITYTAM